jgi:hypothetical protein
MCVVGLRPKLLSFLGQVWPLTPTCQIQKKSNGEGQRKGVYYTTQAAMGSGKVAVQLIFSHLLQTDTWLLV